MVDELNDDDKPVETACPHCGHVSTVQSTDTLSPQVCTNCQKMHVATMSMSQATDQPAEPEKEPADRDAAAGATQAVLGKIARYRVSGVLGSGAYGVVYKAWDPRLERWVAIKVPKLVSRRKQVIEDVLREARTAAGLRHPRIVSVYDADVASGRPFIVAEFVEGSTLASQLENGSIAPRRAARIVYELAVALNYAHQQKIVHRDVKPGNVMIDDHGLPRLMDFGLAQVSTNLPNSADGKIAGTPAYMPPEMARGDLRRTGTSSDQYSLGVVFFECLLGHRPFDGPHRPFDGNLQRLLRTIANESPPRPRSLLPEIPAALDEICAKMTALEPEDRFEDLGTVAKQLLTFLKPNTKTEINTVTQDDLNAARNTRIRISVASIAAAVVLFLLIVSFLNRQDVADPPPKNPAPAPSELAAVEIPANGNVTTALTTPPDSSHRVEVAANSPNVVAPQANSNEIVTPTEPPADALVAIKVAMRAPVEFKVANVKPSYPRILIEPGADLDRFVAEFDAMLAAGFPEKNKRLDDAGFSVALRQFAKLKTLAPREPRVPYAMALIRRDYIPGKDANKKEIPEELDLLKASQQVGGYPFTPAYLSELDYLFRRPSSKIEAIRDSLVATADAVAAAAEWPDASERQRVCVWLGKSFAFYNSGLSGKPGNDKLIKTCQTAVETALPNDLRSTFLTSLLETQQEIGEESASSDEKVKLALAENLNQTKQKLEKSIEEQGQIAGELEKQRLEGESLEDWVERLMKGFDTEYQALQRSFTASSLQAGTLQQQWAIAQAPVQRALNSIAKLNAKAATGVPPDPTFLVTAQQELAFAQARAEPIRLQLMVVNAEIQQLNNQAAVLGRKSAEVERIYKQQKGAKLEAIAKLNRDLKSLDQSVKGTTAQIGKLPTNVMKGQSILKDIRSWVKWSNADAKRWLIDSIPHAEDNVKQ